MMIRFGLQTGLRREEIATFPVTYVVNPRQALGSTRHIRVRLDPRDGNGMRTKGSKKRDIFVSRHLIQGRRHYVTHVRGTRASLYDETHPQLFLDQRGNLFTSGGIE